jgi:glutaredoxin 3
MFCNMVKEFLAQRDVNYVERDVSVDEIAFGDLSKLGFMTTPVTVIGDEVVIGFDKQKLEELLNESIDQGGVVE